MLRLKPEPTLLLIRYRAIGEGFLLIWFPASRFSMGNKALALADEIQMVRAPEALLAGEEEREKPYD